MIEIGFNPIIGYCLLLIAFVGVSVYLFALSEFAPWIFILIALYFISKLSDRDRNDFLKSVFSGKTYLKLRVIENVIPAFPFLAFLAYQQSFPAFAILALMTVLMALFNLNSAINFTIPSPFYKKPFEFTVGWRNSFFLIFFAYFLTIMAIMANNFNLGAFALLLVFLVSLSYYSKPDDEYYVWIFNKSAQGFLWEKIKIAVIYSTMLTLPILITLGIFYFSQLLILLALMLVGFVYLIAIILAKYAAFPHQMNVPQGILLGSSFLFPPMLLAIIPFFYLQARRRLNDILI